MYGGNKLEQPWSQNGEVLISIKVTEIPSFRLKRLSTCWIFFFPLMFFKRMPFISNILHNIIAFYVI